MGVGEEKGNTFSRLTAKWMYAEDNTVGDEMHGCVLKAVDSSGCLPAQTGQEP